MKALNAITLFLVFVAIASCKAQVITYPINAVPENPSNPRYLKDMNNTFEDYNGTWTYSGGNHEMTLQLLAKDSINDRPNAPFIQFEDMIVGEFKHVVNGVYTVDSLEPTLLFKGDTKYHSIWGNLLVDMSWGRAPMCNNCNLSDDVVQVYLSPNGWHLNIEMTLHHYIENGIEKLQVRMYQTDLLQDDDYTGPVSPPMPMGEYIFIKQ